MKANTLEGDGVLTEHRLAAIVESSADAIISKDLNGIITSWNEAAKRLFDYEAEEIVVTILIPPERLREEEGILARIRRGERIEHYETIRRRKDRGLVDISLTVSPIKDEQDRIIGASKIARDITERKRATESLAAHARRAEALSTIAGELLLTDSPRALLASIFKRAATSLSAELYFNYLVSDEGTRLVLESCAGLTDSQWTAFSALAFGQALCGTSPEGTLSGTPNQYTAYNGILDFPIADQLKFYDAWGSAATYPHMAVAWSWAFDTPFKWTKQIASHFGGTRQGLAISWPARIKDAGGIRHQFHHIIDIVPTILEATGIKAPEMVDGIQQKPIEGVSMVYTFDQANADAPSTRRTQYFEMISNRGIYHDGWYANTTPPHGPWILNAPLPAPTEYKWELYNLTEDYSQANDLAAKMPDKLKEMQALFEQEAAKYNVFPLDNRSFARAVEPRPSTTAGKTEFTYTGVNAGIATANAPNILGKSYTITAEVTVPQGGGDGMILTAGGRWGGYGLYLLKGKPVFNYNMLILAQYRWEGQEPLSAGKHTIVLDYTYDRPGIAKGGSGELKVDGKVVATGKQPNSIAFLQVADETFDIGVDTRTSVNEQDYQVPFPFNGTIDKLTFKLGPSQLAEEDQKKAAEVVARARD